MSPTPVDKSPSASGCYIFQSSSGVWDSGSGESPAEGLTKPSQTSHEDPQKSVSGDEEYLDEEGATLSKSSRDLDDLDTRIAILDQMRKALLTLPQSGTVNGTYSIVPLSEGEARS